MVSWHCHMDSSSPIQVWVLNQTGVPQQLSTRSIDTKPLDTRPAAPAAHPSTSSAAPPEKVPVTDNIRATMKHGNINYQPSTSSTRSTPAAPAATKNKERPTTTLPTSSPGTVRRNKKTVIPSSPVSHTSFVFQDIDPNIINGHKTSLSPRRFYNEHCPEKRPPGPRGPPWIPPPEGITKGGAAPFDKMCGNEEQIIRETNPSFLSDPYTGEIKKEDLRPLFPISPTPMDHDYFFSMGQEETLLDIFDISSTDLF
eukprot:sb/3468598/